MTDPVFAPENFSRYRAEKGDAAVISFMSGFPEMARYQLVGMSRAAEAREWAGVGRTAGNMRDQGLSLGMLRLAALCDAVAIACAEGRTGDIPRLLGNVQEHFHEAISALRDHVDGLDLKS